MELQALLKLPDADRGLRLLRPSRVCERSGYGDVGAGPPGRALHVAVRPRGHLTVVKHQTIYWQFHPAGP